jgi:hypothetical protein
VYAELTQPPLNTKRLLQHIPIASAEHVVRNDGADALLSSFKNPLKRGLPLWVSLVHIMQPYPMLLMYMCSIISKSKIIKAPEIVPGLAKHCTDSSCLG